MVNKRITYAHVGFPKCASTALQFGFFARHDELFHLGVNAGGQTAPYRSTEIRNLIEVDLRVLNGTLFSLSKANQIITKYEKEFEESPKKAFGLSSESFTMHMGNELDVDTKAKRLRDIMGPDCRILLVLRNQPDLLKSLYREFIKSGLWLKFGEFVEAIWVNQVHSVLAEFDYASAVERYRNLFGNNNVLILFYEELKGAPGRFLKKISDHIGVSDEIRELKKKNKGPGEAVLEHLRRLNFEEPSGLGGHMLEPLNSYRAPEFVSQLGPQAVKASENLAQKKQAKKIRAKEAAKKDPSVYLDYGVNPDLWKMVLSFYAKTNRRLAPMVTDDIERYGYIGLNNENEEDPNRPSVKLWDRIKNIGKRT